MVISPCAAAVLVRVQSAGAQGPGQITGWGGAAEVHALWGSCKT